MDKAELLNSNELKKAILEQMEAKAKEFKLTGIERIKKIHLTNQPFST